MKDESMPSHSEAAPVIDRLRFVKHHPVYREAPARFALRALWYLSRERLLGGDRIAFTACDGLRFESPRHNYSSFVTAIFGQRDLNIVRFWRRFLTPGSIFFDIGANIGLYTVPASRHVGPQGRVFGFEAHPQIYRYLSRNVVRNCDANVVIENLAVGENNGEISISFQTSNPGETHVATRTEAGERVPVIALDEYCVSHHVHRIDYMKLDVEGYETKVLRGAAKIVAASDSILIQTEYEPRHLQRYGQPTELPELLRSWGFRPHRVDWSGNVAPLESLERYHGEIIWSRRDLSH
jgi:FkbM family methyltransferase